MTDNNYWKMDGCALVVDSIQSAWLKYAKLEIGELAQLFSNDLNLK